MIYLHKGLVWRLWLISSWRLTAPQTLIPLSHTEFYVPWLYLTQILEYFGLNWDCSESRRSCRRRETEGRNKSATRELESIDVSEDTTWAQPNGSIKTVIWNLEWSKRSSQGTGVRTKPSAIWKWGREITCEQSNHPAALASVGAG